MKYHVLILIFFIQLLRSNDHLLFSRIVIFPNEAEVVTILNPTENDINISDYYLSDHPEYYRINEGDSFLGSKDFVINLPNQVIKSQDSLVIAFNEGYESFYLGNLFPDLVLSRDIDTYEYDSDINVLKDSHECLVLFYWDGEIDSPVKDIDYFIWAAGGSSNSQAIDKTDISGYNDDTMGENQDIFDTVHEKHYSFFRRFFLENESKNGNGILGEDETSEKLNFTWEIRESPEFKFGCTAVNAVNYDSTANTDSGLCHVLIKGIIDGGYQLEGRVAVLGRVVDYFDIATVYGSGPQLITIQGEMGYRITIVVYHDDFEVSESDIAPVISGFTRNNIILHAEGQLDFYEDRSEWQLKVTESDVKIVDSQTPEGDYIPFIYLSESSESKVKLEVAPFVLIPSLGETLDFSFTVLDNSHAIVRIFDLSGNFVTSLVDDYYELEGIVSHLKGLSPWNGRDKLGQIVSPGTYIMHLEVFNPATGETQTDAAPIVVGVKN